MGGLVCLALRFVVFIGDRKMNKDWTYIDEAEPITSDVTAVHCDTRDFAVICRDKVYTKEDNKEIYRLLHGAKINEKFLIAQDKIIPWLKQIESIAGGKNKWRMLNFSNVNTSLGWLKYIRFYRYYEDKFVVCGSYSSPIDWSKCDESTLEKKYLCAHS